MNKLSSIFSLGLIFLLFSSCAPDLTEEIEAAYDGCYTVDGNMWSPKASSTMNWSDAIDYCNNLTACGYSDWHLPTISELRTLIQNCSETQTGGSCGVTDSCLSYSECQNISACNGCGFDDSGKYSKLGDDDDVWLWWSSSTRSDGTDGVWIVGFDYGYVGNGYKSNNFNVRCVR